MPRKTQQSKMPAGKMQFGIIVPVEVHRQAKRLATEADSRISDMYADGIRELSGQARKHPGPGYVKVPHKAESIVKAMADASEEDIVYHKALADFLHGRPRQDQMTMLKVLLSKYLPAETLEEERIVNG